MCSVWIKFCYGPGIFQLSYLYAFQKWAASSCKFSSLAAASKNVKVVSPKISRNTRKVGKSKYIKIPLWLLHCIQTNFTFLSCMTKPLNWQKFTTHFLKGSRLGISKIPEHNNILIIRCTMSIFKGPPLIFSHGEKISISLSFLIRGNYFHYKILIIMATK